MPEACGGPHGVLSFWESKNFWCVRPCPLGHFYVPGPICWSKDRKNPKKKPYWETPTASSPREQGSEVEGEAARPGTLW